MSYYVYVIKSQLEGRLYKGMTNDVEKRLREHNAGKSFSTKPYIPWSLVYFKAYETRIEAREYEKFLKSGSGREFLRTIL